MEKSEIIRMLERKIFRFQGLIETSTMLTTTLECKEVISRIVSISTSVMEAEASCLMLLDESGKNLSYEVVLGEKNEAIRNICSIEIGQGIAGWVAQNQKPLNVPDVSKDSRFLQRIDDATGFNTKAILCVPLCAKKKIIGVLEVMNPCSKDSFSEEDTEILSAFAAQAAVAIENARMHEYKLKQQVLDRDLSIAREIQGKCIPSKLPPFPGCDVSASTIPAYKIGGDFYDVISFQENKSGFIVGDVSGKGIPAALYMVRTVTSLHAELVHREDPEIILKHLNNFLCKESTRGMFVTMLFGVISHETNTIQLFNAGHVPAVVYKAKDRKGQVLQKIHGPLLGVVKDAFFPSQKITLDTGDILVLYTDGVIEAGNSRNEDFGMERLVSIIEKTTHLSAYDIECTIIDAVKKFSGTDMLADDLTLMVIKRTM